MRQVRCRGCESTVTLRSEFEEDCPECGAGVQDLEDLDSYGDDPDFELMCSLCGWEIESGSEVEWDEGCSGRLTVDDSCPICDLAGLPGQVFIAKYERNEDRLRPEYGTARAAANRLRLEHTDGSVPVDVDRVALAVGLRVVRRRWPHDGLLDGSTIQVPIDAPAVERFVIAHEIGHFELRHTINASKIEPEANAFASELLIPRKLLVDLMAATSPSITGVARHFGVSRQAAAFAVTSARQLGRLSN